MEDNDEADGRLIAAIEVKRSPALRAQQRVLKQTLGKNLKRAKRCVTDDIWELVDDMDGNKAEMVREACQHLDDMYSSILIMTQAGYPYWKGEVAKSLVDIREEGDGRAGSSEEPSP